MGVEVPLFSLAWQICWHSGPLLGLAVAFFQIDQWFVLLFDIFHRLKIKQMLQELFKPYLQLLVFAACWEHLPNMGNMANIRGANLSNHHKQPNCQTAQLRLQTTLRQDLFTFPCSRPSPPKICNLTSRDCERSLMAAPGLWPDNGQTGLTFPPGGLAPFKQPPAADKRCVSTSASVRLLLPRVGLVEQSTLWIFHYRSSLAYM